MSRMHQKKEVETSSFRDHRGRKHTIMSPEDANSGKKSVWSELEITEKDVPATLLRKKDDLAEWTVDEVQ